MEIEKKYQIKEMPCLDGAMTKEMEQGYLCTDPVVRIRRSNDKYILTCKSFDGMIGERRADVRMCQEYEINLPEESYKHLRQKVDGGLISKTRYIIPLADGHIAELDVFHGIYEGVVFAEIEFSSEEQAYNTELPKWFGKEVSSKITNSDMAFSNSKDVLKLIEDIKTGN
jgi:adenylate cyclase